MSNPRKYLEPMPQVSYAEQPAVSQAISLKRIADALEAIVPLLSERRAVEAEAAGAASLIKTLREERDSLATAIRALKVN